MKLISSQQIGQSQFKRTISQLKYAESITPATVVLHAQKLAVSSYKYVIQKTYDLTSTLMSSKN